MASDPVKTESLRIPELRGNLSSDSSLNASDWSLRRRLKTRDHALTQYTGKGEDDSPRSPMKKAHKKSGSVQLNGRAQPKEQHASDLVVEDLKDRNGVHLTTLRRADTELVSGRRAGAGWEMSRRVCLLTGSRLSIANLFGHIACALHLSQFLSNAGYKLSSFSPTPSASPVLSLPFFSSVRFPSSGLCWFHIFSMCYFPKRPILAPSATGPSFFVP